MSAKIVDFTVDVFVGVGLDGEHVGAFVGMLPEVDENLGLTL